jgi:hypothetical protein
MLNELPFYEVDQDWLGDSSDDEGLGGGEEDEDKLAALLRA